MPVGWRRADLKGAFAKTGGAIRWRGPLDDPMISGLTPTKQWLSPDGKKGAFVFFSSDVKLVQGARIKPATQLATQPSTSP